MHIIKQCNQIESRIEFVINEVGEERSEFLAELCHEIPFLFPAAGAILALCALLVYDLSQGANPWVVYGGITVALVSIATVFTMVLKLRNFDSGANPS